MLLYFSRRLRRGEQDSTGIKYTPCGVCALSGTTSSLRGSCRLWRGEPTARAQNTLLAEWVPFQGLLRRFAPRAIASQWGEPTSENNISFFPTLSFGCGSSPESATKEKEECKSIPLFLGALSGTRTLGPLIKSQLLYQLS